MKRNNSHGTAKLQNAVWKTVSFFFLILIQEQDEEKWKKCNFYVNIMTNNSILKKGEKIS